MVQNSKTIMENVTKLSKQNTVIVYTMLSIKKSMLACAKRLNQTLFFFKTIWQIDKTNSSHKLYKQPVISIVDVNILHQTNFYCNICNILNKKPSYC